MLQAKSEEGLSRLLAHLRGEEEREFAAEIERLKPVARQVNSCSSQDQSIYALRFAAYAGMPL